MANLGAISQGSTSIFQERLLPFWRGYGTTKQMSAIDMTDTITVTVKLDGVVQAKSKVNLYYRPTGKLIKTSKTDGSGQVTFANIDTDDLGNYYVVALSSGSLNALVFDKL